MISNGKAGQERFKIQDCSGPKVPITCHTARDIQYLES